MDMKEEWAKYVTMAVVVSEMADNDGIVWKYRM